VLGAFLRGQLTVMLALGVLYAAGLSIVGVDFALLIGLIAGLVSFVPYLGLIVGIIIATIAVLFQSHDITQVLWVFGVFAIVQLLEGTVLTPLLVGDKIGLHPVTVIFAVMAGGQLFGFFGILVALPVAAVLAVIMRHLRASYKQSQIYDIGYTPQPESEIILTSKGKA
jgi:predicted PurR-regulated permease PerM